jgi:hypothetical protein
LDNIYYEKTLNRILQGRLRIRVGDLVLFIYEPNRDVVEESFEIYEDAREKAYFSGCYVEEEIINLLVENDIWTPRDDKEAEKINKEIEQLKVEALNNFFRKKELTTTKRKIRRLEKKYSALKQKRITLDHLSCDGVAQFSRRCWILSKTTKTADNKLYSFLDINVKDMLEIYSANAIPSQDIRYLANNLPWRQMWNSSKNRESLLGKPSSDLTTDQISLVAFSQMFDNVYQDPEQPTEEIINDDDCLDGWFIAQREKNEKDKKQQQVDNSLPSKVANSQEVMLMANNNDEAQEIYGLNSAASRNIIRQREADLKAANEPVDFKNFTDVKQQRMINAVNQQSKAINARGK